MNAWEGVRVLVTGSGSFIGKEVTRQLLESGAVVRCAVRSSTRSAQPGSEVVRGDLRDARFAREVASDIDTVFHVASNNGERTLVDTQPIEVWGNLELDHAMIKAAHDAGVKRFVYTSSANVYPATLREAGTVLQEDRVGPPFNPDGAFGWTKLTAEQMLFDCRAKGMSGVSCRLFSVYGEDAGHQNAISALVRRALRCEQPIELWGGGEQRRSWIHVTDVAAAFLAAAENSEKFSAVNVASQEATPMREVVGHILAATKCSIEPISIPYAGGAIAHHSPDISLLTGIGWSPAIALQAGIVRVVEKLRSAA